MKKFGSLKKIIYLLTLLMFVNSVFVVANADFSLTEEEKEYVKQNPNPKIHFSIGDAPIQYRNVDEEFAGITYEFIQEIENLTGFEFELIGRNANDRIDATQFDLIAGASLTYGNYSYRYSEPYLVTQEFLFMNKNLKIESLKELESYTYGYTTPYNDANLQALTHKRQFKNSQALLRAVNDGTVDYGVTSIYTINYYITHFNLKNIEFVPTSMEGKDFRFLYVNDDPIFMSIIDKAIASVDDETFRLLFIKASASKEEGMLLYEMFEAFKSYFIYGIIACVAIILYYALRLKKAKKSLDSENQRFHILSNISDEMLFQYNLDTQIINFQGKESLEFKKAPHYEETKLRLKNFLNQKISDGVSSLKYEKKDGEVVIIRVYHYNLIGESNFIIGKIIDVTEEVNRHNSLLNQARVDGLTNLYNAKYTKAMVETLIESKPQDQVDALIIIDMDNFKKINDTYGHLQGDVLLQEVSVALSATFNNASIIGRMGGDEFLVYNRDIMNNDKCCDQAYSYLELLKTVEFPIEITSSVGVSLITDQTSYEKIFYEADYALYQAKRLKNRVKVYQEVSYGEI